MIELPSRQHWVASWRHARDLDTHCVEPALQRRRIQRRNSFGERARAEQTGRIARAVSRAGARLRPDRGDPPAAKFLWPENRAPSKRILSNTSTPTAQGEYIYGCRPPGELVCLEGATGRQIWSTNSVTTTKNGASINITPQSIAGIKPRDHARGWTW